MTTLPTCPTCGRKGSERHGRKHTMDLGGIKLHGFTWDCPDPLHDLADRAPLLRRDALEEACAISEKAYEFNIESQNKDAIGSRDYYRDGAAAMAAHSIKTKIRALIAREKKSETETKKETK